MTQRLKEKVINVNPHQDATVRAMTTIIGDILYRNPKFDSRNRYDEVIARALYVKGYRKTIK